MVWDGVMLLLVITLCVVGWNIGIINSWRAPIGIVAATFITHLAYVEVATHLVHQTRMTPEQAIGIAYVLIWSIADVFIEVLLRFILPFNRKAKPLFFDRLFGALLGLVRALIIIILPCIAVAAQHKVPTAPKDRSALIMPVESNIESSTLLPVFKTIAKAVPSPIKSFVVSTKEPSFEPQYEDQNRPEQPQKI